MLADLPPAAAPLAVTVAGGLALLVVLGTFLSRQATTPPPPQAAEAVVEEEAAAPAPAERERTEAAPVRTAALGARLPAAALSQPDDPRPPALSREDEAALRDPARTGSIPRALIAAGATEPPVPVAETEADLLALEAIQMQEVEADLSEPSQEATAAIAAPAAAPKRAAIATKYVNMRAGPADDAEVLTVVPALAEIEAEEECDWCAVTYDGRAGFIYRTFISYRG